MGKKIGYINDIKDFFEINLLMLDDSKCDNNFYIYEKDPTKITPDDLINDSLRERMRRFNTSTLNLLVAVERMILFWNASLANNEMQANNIFNYRIACRDVCINIDIYVDKIKAFCRYYFYMGEKVIDDSKEWAKTLNLFMELDPSSIKTFLNKCVEMMDNGDYKFVHNIRNDEIHNESILDLRNFRFAEDGTLNVIDEGYKLSNITIIETIQRVLPLLFEVRSALQAIINSIPSHKIATYVSDNEDKLKNIIKHDERYRMTKDATEKRYNII